MIEKSQTTSSLIAIAYQVDDEDKYWEIIGELHKRGSKLEFDAAKKLVKSEDAIERQVGADILGQLGWLKKMYQCESVSILIQLLNDSSTDVIASAAFSLGHRHDSKAIPYLIELVEHQNSRVRYGVVFGLSGFDDDIAVEALIKLSRDENFDVRNWATFELGSLCDVDTKELRAALYERISDSEYEIRGEALVGLAMRKDINIQKNLLRELEGEFNGIWAVEAAKILATHQYCEVLTQLRDRLIAEKEEERFLSGVNDAISSCCQNKT